MKTYCHPADVKGETFEDVANVAEDGTVTIKKEVTQAIADAGKQINAALKKGGYEAPEDDVPAGVRVLRSFNAVGAATILTGSGGSRFSDFCDELSRGEVVLPGIKGGKVEAPNVEPVEAVEAAETA